jgi:D-alanine-D-alanine ligase
MIKVGVIRGGISNEYEISMLTGFNILGVLNNSLPKYYTGIDIVVSKHGIWTANNKEISLEELPKIIDVAFIALHGIYGEDGQIQTILEKLQIPYTGSEPLASRIGLDKQTTKEYAKKLKILVPKDIIIEQFPNSLDISYEQYVENAVKQIIQKVSPPWVIKTIRGGSSLDVYIINEHNLIYQTLLQLLKFHTIIIEEYIEGKEGTVGVLEHFRGKEIYAFLPIEIRKQKGRFFDYDSKYNGEAQEISPGNFNQEEKEIMMRYAKEIHKGIGLRHYSRSDFIVAKNNKVYFLEVNNLPGLTRESLLPKSLAPVGATFPQFIDHLIRLALESKIV